MADISLLFDVAGGGSISGESGSLISSQLTSIINTINRTPLGIKVKVDDASLAAFRAQIQSVTKSVGSVGTLSFKSSDIANMTQSVSRMVDGMGSFSDTFRSMDSWLGNISADLLAIRDSLDAIIHTLPHGEDALASMAQSGSAGMNDMVQKLSELKALLESINNKNFNISNVFEFKKGSKDAAGEIDLYRTKATELLNVVVQLQGSLDDVAHRSGAAFTKALKGTGELMNFWELSDRFKGQEFYAGDIAGASTVSNLNKIIGLLAEYKRVYEVASDAARSAGLEVKAPDLSGYNTALKHIEEYNAKATELERNFVNAANAAAGVGSTQQGSGNQSVATYTEQVRTMCGDVSTLLDEVRAKIESTFDFSTLTPNTSTITAALEELKQRVDDIQGGSSNQNPFGKKTGSRKIKEGSTQYSADLKQIKTLLGQVTEAQKKWTAAQHGSTSGEYDRLQTYADDLAALEERLRSGSLTQTQFNKEMRGLQASFTQTRNTIKAAGENTQTFTERMGTLTAKFGEWFSMTRIVMAAFRSVKQMVSGVIELDTAMTELKKVTDETDVAYAQFLDNAANRAKKLGASLTDIVSSTADFARLGFDVQDAEKLADAAIVYKNVGDGISDIGEATESIIATMQAFGVEADNVMSIVDKFNNVGNKFAISSGGIGDAMLRASAAMRSANNTIDETIALITAANTIVQNPESVGTTMKTVSMYLRAAKTEAESAGESTEGMANSVGELRKEIMRLTGNRVDIQIDENTFKSTYQIMKELADVWGDLSDISQANILEMVGGKRNSNVVAALLENFTIAEEALKASVDSAGSAMAENEKVLDSIQGKINILKASFQELSQSLIDSDLVKNIVMFATALLGVVDDAARIVNALGGLKTVLLGVGSVLLIVKAEWIALHLEMLKTAILKGVTTAFTAIKSGLLNVVKIIPNAIAAWKAYAAGTISANAAMQASIPVIGLVLGALTALVAGMSLYQKKAAEDRQATLDDAKAVTEQTEAMESAYIAYMQYARKTNLTATEEDQFASAIESVSDALKTKTSALESAKRGTEEYTQAVRDAAKADLEGALAAAKQASKAARDTLSDATYGFWSGSKVDFDVTKRPSSSAKDMAAYQTAHDIMSAYVSDGAAVAGRGASTQILSFKPTDASDIDDIIQYYYSLRALQNELALQDNMNNAVYENSIKITRELDDVVKQYLNTKLEELSLSYKIEKGIPATLEEYKAYRQFLVDTLTSTYNFYGDTNTLSALVDSFMPDHFKNISGGSGGGGDINGAVGETVSTLSDLAESLTRLKSAYSALDDAQKEMATNGGLSADTIKDLAGITDDYIDYLYEENGAIKLNIDAWKEMAGLEMAGNIDAIKAESLALEEQYHFIESSIEALQNATIVSDDFVGPLDLVAFTQSEWNKEMAKQKALLKENTEAMKANQHKLALYEALYKDATKELDAYAAALKNFTNVADKIGSVTDALTTVANIQQAVADGFTISLEKALEFAAVYPEILNNASVASNGQIKLNKNIVNAFIKGKESELKAQIDAEVAKLEAEKAALDVKMMDVAIYENAIAQLDGQIAALKALRGTSLKDLASGDSGSGSSSGSKKETWFEKQYKLHNHLREMDAEEEEAYLKWLNEAYQKAYKQGIIDLDAFYQYQEEVYKGLQNLFKDYLNDIEHEISMREHFDGESAKIIKLYETLIADVEKEIRDARAKGLDNNDDYIQELQNKYFEYTDAIKSAREDANDAAERSVKELIDIRMDMLKEDVEAERDAIRDKLDHLKDFYQKQKDMLQDAYDEERYLEEQAEKRKAVADIQAEIESLRFDDSAWAQKRKLDLAQELADAQKDLDEFERDQALKIAQDKLDSLYEMQEKELEAEEAQLESKLDDAKTLYEQALEDIRNGSVSLYEEMLEWNAVYGDGIDETIKTAWEEAYVALKQYSDLYGSLYKDINLENATGYTPAGGSWDTHVISGGGSSGSSSSGSQTAGAGAAAPSKGASVQVKSTATHFGSNSGGAKMRSYVPGGKYTVYKISKDGSQILIGRNGVYTGWVNKSDLVGYATGTRNAVAGLHPIHENGHEYIFTSADGSRYRLFEGGEKVLNANATNFLYDFANSGGKILGDMIRRFTGGLGRSNGGATAVQITMGDIIIRGNTDQKTVSEIRRAQRDGIDFILKEFNKLNK